MEEGLALLAAQVDVGIAKDETDSGEEIALSGAIASDNNIGPWGEGLNDGLVLVAKSKGSVRGR